MTSAAFTLFSTIDPSLRLWDTQPASIITLQHDHVLNCTAVNEKERSIDLPAVWLSGEPHQAAQQVLT